MGRLIQVLELIRRFGFFHLLKVKSRHDRVLPHVRGYVTVRVFWALLYAGVLDELAASGPRSIDELATKFDLKPDVLRDLCQYMDCVRVLKCVGPDRYELDGLGRVMLAEPRGVLDLLYGYEPVFVDLEDLLRGRKQYGRDVSRNGKYIAIGSGELGRQLPFPIMADLVRRHNFKNLLDLGCGDLEFLMAVCRRTGARGYGVDNSAEAVEHARQRLAQAGMGDCIEVEQADMFHLDAVAPRLNGVDCLTVCDTFHEYLSDGTELLSDLLVHLRAQFPGRAMLVAEFCRQSHESLKKRPTAFLEHHLFHRLTHQEILSAPQWRRLFEVAGWRVVDEHVFEVVGHGYFVLKQA